jgi:hypothetical protein
VGYSVKGLFKVKIDNVGTLALIKSGREIVDNGKELGRHGMSSAKPVLAWRNDIVGLEMMG